MRNSSHVASSITGSRPHPDSQISLWARIIAAARWLDDSWLGDLIGALCLATTGYILFVFAGVLS